MVAALIKQLLLRRVVGKINEIVAEGEELIGELALGVTNVVTVRADKDFGIEYDSLNRDPSSLGLLEFVFGCNRSPRRSAFLGVFKRVTDVEFIVLAAEL